MSRARNGTGTITQRADGRWQGQLRLDGRRVTVYGRSHAEAAAKLDELCRQAHTQGIMPKSVTLGELLDRWLEAVGDSLKPRTLADYRRVAAIIRNDLGERKQLSKLTPEAIKRYYSGIKAHPRRALYAHQVLHRAFRLAVQWGWLPSNPADRVFRPGYRKKDKPLWT